MVLGGVWTVIERKDTAQPSNAVYVMKSNHTRQWVNADVVIAKPNQTLFVAIVEKQSVSVLWVCALDVMKEAKSS